MELMREWEPKHNIIVAAWEYEETTDCFSGTPGARWNGGSDCYECDYLVWIPNELDPSLAKNDEEEDEIWKQVDAYIDYWNNGMPWSDGECLEQWRWERLEEAWEEWEVSHEHDAR